MIITSTTVGTTIASTTAGTTIAATVIVGYINYRYNKYSRRIPKASFYFYFACLYNYYYYCITRATKTNSTVQQQITKPVQACFKPI
jgi:tellurite resistance protein TehA-like permease